MCRKEIIGRQRKHTSLPSNSFVMVLFGCFMVMTRNAHEINWRNLLLCSAMVTIRMESTSGKRTYIRLQRNLGALPKLLWEVLRFPQYKVMQYNYENNFIHLHIYWHCIQLLHRSYKSLTSWIMKNNFINSSITEKKISWLCVTRIPLYNP